jgi:hypothetical protein
MYKIAYIKYYIKYISKKIKIMIKKITVEFKSRSQPGTVYKTERHRDGRVTCFCPGFVYSGSCWHSKQVQNAVVTELVR